MHGIKNCPFCGGEAFFHSYIIEVVVHCGNCKAYIQRPVQTGPQMAEHEIQAVKEVTAAWNKRVHLDLRPD